MSKLKVLLVSSKEESMMNIGFNRTIDDHPMLPLGIAQLAAVIEHECDVYGMDMSCHTFDQFREKIRAWQPDIVGISAMTASISSSFKLARIAKEEYDEVLNVLGGPHSTIRPQEVIKNEYVDLVVIGEGEKTFNEIVKTYIINGDWNKVDGIVYKENGKIIINNVRDFIEDMDTIPLPAWHTIPEVEEELKKNKKGFIMAGRGCPGRCTFCQPTLMRLFGKKIRYKSPEYLIKEIKMLKNKYSVKSLYFCDDTLTANKTWINNFCDLLIEEEIDIKWLCQGRVNTVDKDILQKMKEAGCYLIMFGVESGSQKILSKVYKKGIKISQVENAFKWCHEVGILPHAYFIIGTPSETEDDIDMSLQLMKKIKPSFYTLSMLTPYPGTYLYESMGEDSIFKQSEESSQFTYEPKFKNTVTKEKILKTYAEFHKIWFFSHLQKPKNLLCLVKHMCTLSHIVKNEIKNNLHSNRRRNG